MRHTESNTSLYIEMACSFKFMKAHVLNQSIVSIPNKSLNWCLNAKPNC